ncbi:20920_t:CDS:1 [Gigaspora margarita]|uniref:20920_t:CDS:1 n=1 Tax=Gigaspora margarita TaxID=4874 RepID=A0ABN7VP32_GIGMA|nr:20920_t:CDS:1 [Gigaspora margarita]
MTLLNRYNFFLTVVKGNNEHSKQPGYLCNCNSFYTTKPSSSSTNAIFMIYQQIFRTKTRFSGPLVMGFNKPDIYEKLLERVLFQLYFIDLKLVQIFVFGLAQSNNNLLGYADIGFKSSFLFQLEKQCCLFLQEIKDDICKVTIIQKAEIKKVYYDYTPDFVWKKIYNEIKLLKYQNLQGNIIWN